MTHLIIRYTKLAVLVIVATSASLLFAEIALRRIIERPVLTTEWIHEHPLAVDPDMIVSNSAFRTDAYYEVKGDRPVIVLLGDSFTQGYPVADDDGYPEVLDKMLAAARIPADVIDLGMGDTGPDLHLRLFEREVLARLTPDVVIWQFYPNDLWDNVTKPVYTLSEGELRRLDVTRNWLLLRHAVHEAMPLGDALLKHSYLYRLLLSFAEYGRTAAVPERYQAKPRDWGLEKIEAEVARMNATAEAKGFSAYYVLVAPQAIESSERSDKERASQTEQWGRDYERLLAVFEEEPGFIDARYYEVDGRTLRRDVFVGSDRDPLPPRARHYNEEGYRLLAKQIFDRLRNDGVLSD